jgi:hypothetical protein
MPSKQCALRHACRVRAVCVPCACHAAGMDAWLAVFSSLPQDDLPIRWVHLLNHRRIFVIGTEVVIGLRRRRTCEREMKVALFEDNPAMMEMMETALDMQGYGGEPCASGETLLAALLASRGEQGNGALPFDLLLLDCMLPCEMNGGEVIATVRQ